MARVEGELVIDRPVDEVFDFVADERDEPRCYPRLPRVEQVSPGRGDDPRAARRAAGAPGAPGHEYSASSGAIRDP